MFSVKLPSVFVFAFVFAFVFFVIIVFAFVSIFKMSDVSSFMKR